MSAFEPAEAEWEAPRRKRAPWGVIALVLLTGLALIRNGSGEVDVGPPQPAGAAAADTRRPGPAVFYGLGALKKGSRVEVLRKDGKTAVFEVYGIEVFAKNNFPGDRVYGSKGSAELRVITCGGGFSKQNGYDGNVVVFARLAEVR